MSTTTLTAGQMMTACIALNNACVQYALTIKQGIATNYATNFAVMMLERSMELLEQLDPKYAAETKKDIAYLTR